MTDLSLFWDESGEAGTESKYYCLTLVIHDQSHNIRPLIQQYEEKLRERGLPNIPMHMSPLMNGHDEYRNLTVAERRRLFLAFFTLLQHLPLSYHTFIYQKAQFSSMAQLEERMKRNLTNFFFDHIAFVSSFDQVKIYYDYAQKTITRVIRDAVEYVTFRGARVYRQTSAEEYRLVQAADLICTIELAATKYSRHEETATDRRILGNTRSFKSNVLKKLRRQRLD